MTYPYWVLKSRDEPDMYRMFIDSSHATTGRRRTIRFATKKEAFEARDSSCCSDLWAVVRVDIA